MSNIEEEPEKLVQDIPIEADDVTVQTETKGGKEVVIYSYYTIKLSFRAGDSAYEACINKLKEIFNTF